MNRTACLLHKTPPNIGLFAAVADISCRLFCSCTYRGSYVRAAFFVTTTRHPVTHASWGKHKPFYFFFLSFFVFLIFFCFHFQMVTTSLFFCEEPRLNPQGIILPFWPVMLTYSPVYVVYLEYSVYSSRGERGVLGICR